MPDSKSTISESKALKLLTDLLKIDGVSSDEKRVAEFITDQLQSTGVPRTWIRMDDANQRSPRGGNCGNLICRFPGTVAGDRRMLSCHMDTVPVCAGSYPKRVGDELISGNPAAGVAGDNRAGVAAVLNTALEIRRRKLPHPPLTFLFTVQEETGLMGARFIDPKLLGDPKLCFNIDGGDPARVYRGATGSALLTVEIQGLASHAGNAPEKGISAIAIAGLAIADLQANGWHGLIVRGRKRGSGNIGIITGGAALNVVADRATIRCELRSHDPVFRKRIVKEYRKAFERAARSVRSAAGQRGKVAFTETHYYESFRLPETDPSVVMAMKAVGELGLEPELLISNAGFDANWLAAHGLNAVTLGSGQHNPHTLAAKVTIPQYLDGCRLALRLATVG